jgi:hypothetical protein
MFLKLHSRCLRILLEANLSTDFNVYLLSYSIFLIKLCFSAKLGASSTHYVTYFFPGFSGFVSDRINLNGFSLSAALLLLPY